MKKLPNINKSMEQPGRNKSWAGNNNRINQMNIKTTFSNPFKVYKNQEKLLLSRELLRGQMHTLKLKSNNVSVVDKLAANRPDRSGVIRQVRAIAPRKISKPAVPRSKRKHQSRPPSGRKMNLFDLTQQEIERFDREEFDKSGGVLVSRHPSEKALKSSRNVSQEISTQLVPLLPQNRYLNHSHKETA